MRRSRIRESVRSKMRRRTKKKEKRREKVVTKTAVKNPNSDGSYIILDLVHIDKLITVNIHMMNSWI